MNWDIKEVHNYNEYMQKYSIHSLLAKIYAQREYNEQDVQGHTSKRLIYHDFSLFLDADLVLDRIQEALENDEKICIYGDYDCDGILSTTILVQTFLELGKKVGYHIPNRFEDGYGLNKERVQQMYEKGYTLLITVDNGIKAYEAIDLANELGIDVIVIDHHDYDELPDACAIIHTKMSTDYPFKEICGGFLAYKLASSLLGKHDKYLFSLAAITTISDMMPLVDENKSLVSRGLQFMNEEKYFQLELLIGENQKYNTTTLGFNIAPKINSFGRLPELVNPNHLVKYFLKDVDQKFAIQISQYAKKINSKRQSLTNEQYKNILENSPKDEFLYSYNQEVHEGIVGLIAGKYTHEFQKPSFVMKYDEKNEVYRGSARSIESIPLNQIFDDLKEHFVQYGGHALAGGFQVAKDEVLTLKEALHTYLISHTFSDEKHLEGIEIGLNELTLPAVRELELLEPYGQCNEEMKFILKDITNFTSRVLSDGKHLRFDIPLNKGNLQALYFNCSKEIEQLQQKKTISLIGTLKINKYLNTESINMIIEDMK